MTVSCNPQRKEQVPLHHTALLTHCSILSTRAMTVVGKHPHADVERAHRELGENALEEVVGGARAVLDAPGHLERLEVNLADFGVDANQGVAALQEQCAHEQSAHPAVPVGEGVDLHEREVEPGGKVQRVGAVAPAVQLQQHVVDGARNVSSAGKARIGSLGDGTSTLR